MEAGINAGMYDLMCYGMTYREEALDRMIFTKPIYEEPVYVVINKAHYAYAQPDQTDDPQDPGSRAEVFFSNLKKSFYRTFLVENRWKSILSGFLVPVELSVLTAVFGTLLGIIWNRKENGSAPNPLESADAVSLSIAKAMAQELTYSCTDSACRITAVIKNVNG